MKKYTAKSGKRYPARYFLTRGLSRRAQLLREKELEHRARNRSARSLGKSDTLVRTAPRKSRWTALFHRVYPNVPMNKRIMSEKFKIPYSTLNTVYRRGERAWQTSGSRPGANPYQWAIARLYKFILIEKGKARPPPGRPDPDADLHKKS